MPISACSRLEGQLADKRTLVGQRNRAAISRAAAELIREEDTGRFTVEELARRAGVSRRTVFNHFGSIEEAAFSELFDRLDRLAEPLEIPAVPEPEQLPAVAVGVFAGFLLRPEPLAAIREMTRLSLRLDRDTRTESWASVAVEHSVELFVQKLGRACPAAEGWQVRLVCGGLISAVEQAVSEGVDRLADEQALRQRLREAFRLLGRFPQEADLPEPAPPPPASPAAPPARDA